MFGNNIKIHFAGAENGNHLYALLAANAKYCLYSPYQFILNKSLDDSFVMPFKESFNAQDALRMRQNNFKHIIQDSGLFTLMFNPNIKREFNYGFLEEWQDKIIAFTEQNNLNVTCVEVDCQKLLGVRDAWRLRERMKKRLSNKQINVFHIEDGKDGLNSLIDFSDYIAISVPELRKVHRKTYASDTFKLAHYIKSRKPAIDIHLLGCTEPSIVSKCSFCTSADSTSWMRGTIYGWGYFYRYKWRRNNICCNIPLYRHNWGNMGQRKSEVCN